VGVLELVVVLEAEAQEPVPADVGEPDDAEGQQERLVLPPPETSDCSWQRVLCARLYRNAPKRSPAR
jgi:hypothetical protein